jgi:hypothetical protein
MTIFPLGKKSRIRATFESKGPYHEKAGKEVEGMPGNYRAAIVRSALIALMGVGILFF